jgi:hypothetical protein
MNTLDITPTKLSMREKTGERTDGYDDRYAPVYTDESSHTDESVCVPACVYDKDLLPENPIPDKRIEMFLDAIVECNAHRTDDYYQLFKKHLTPITGRKEIDKANMRKLMMAPAVRARLKFLRDAEWELNRPSIQGIAQQFEAIIDNEDMMPRDKIAALNSLAKIAGVIEQKTEGVSQGAISVTFNMAEKPKMPINITGDIK